MAFSVVFWLLVGLVVCFGVIAVRISNCPSFVQIPFLLLVAWLILLKLLLG